MGPRGTAIAVMLARQPAHQVRLWRPRKQWNPSSKARRCRFLPGIPIPDRVLLTTDPDEGLKDADLCISAIPTVYLRSTLIRFQNVSFDNPIVSLTKGLEIGTFRRPTEIIEEVLGTTKGVAVLSGPSHAEEVAKAHADFRRGGLRRWSAGKPDPTDFCIRSISGLYQQ